ncbi:hypothetical protein [Micromonospora chalcea]|uniref:hypothetical protein n=1 Tax=Micromonospora chalcea TaxID=1874 RepID=UPI003320577C
MDQDVVGCLVDVDRGVTDGVEQCGEAGEGGALPDPVGGAGVAERSQGHGSEVDGGAPVLGVVAGQQRTAQQPVTVLGLDRLVLDKQVVALHGETGPAVVQRVPVLLGEPPDDRALSQCPDLGDLLDCRIDQLVVLRQQQDGVADQGGLTVPARLVGGVLGPAAIGVMDHHPDRHDLGADTELLVGVP